jgi:hypothetical protein
MVHYPAFRDISAESFVEFEKMHTRNISILVMPLMLLELLAVVVLLAYDPQNLINIALFSMVLLIWLSTFLLSVPCHRKLSKGKDLQIINRLVQTNWVRTVLWSIKGLVLLAD